MPEAWRDTAPRSGLTAAWPKLEQDFFGGLMDYFIVVITSVAGLYFHWWMYVRIKRWVDRDLALSLAGDSPASCSADISRYSTVFPLSKR